MKIEIKLENPKSCEGCIFLQKGRYQGVRQVFCYLRYETGWYDTEKLDINNIVRPMECIEKNGD